MSTPRPTFNEQFRIALQHGHFAPDETGVQSQELERRIKAVSHITGRSIKDSPGGGRFYAPTEWLTRDLSAGVTTAGGFTVGTEKPDLLSLFRPWSAIANLPVTMLSGLVSNLSMPAVATAATAGWSAETAALSTGDPTFSLPVQLSPKLVSATIKFSNKLAAVTGFDFKKAILSELFKSLSAELDRVALLGTGSGNQPIGILNASGTNSITFGAAATWPNVLKFETAIGKNNGTRGAQGWLCSNNTKERWKQIPRTTGGTNFIWEDDQVNGYPAAATSFLDVSDQVIFADWSQLIIAEWAGGIEFVTNPYTYASTNQVQLIASLYCDVGLARPGLFAASSDSAAQ